MWGIFIYIYLIILFLIFSLFKMYWVIINYDNFFTFQYKLFLTVCITLLLKKNDIFRWKFYHTFFSSFVILFLTYITFANFYKFLKKYIKVWHLYSTFCNKFVYFFSFYNRRNLLQIQFTPINWNYFLLNVFRN